ncbi:hypothetical protein CDD80_1952 [Ophiocordyceps camponoti-rufipedis]|uniref:Uncharacterized protein n=1 Tax=Ophiocordyceps camponoti-rufipedis TaxID=2004952 RepID=A0A2C5Z4H6_9HYPO|nr:hypothetical protein CDD80_1952 [Ophiocordyceps camponoti-rufipedis]
MSTTPRDESRRPETLSGPLPALRATLHHPDQPPATSEDHPDPVTSSSTPPTSSAAIPTSKHLPPTLSALRAAVYYPRRHPAPPKTPESYTFTLREPLSFELQSRHLTIFSRQLSALRATLRHQPAISYLRGPPRPRHTMSTSSLLELRCSHLLNRLPSRPHPPNHSPP